MLLAQTAPIPSTFAPTPAVGALTGRLTPVSSNGAAQTVSLAGTGVALSATLTPASFDFGKVVLGKTVSTTFTFTNTSASVIGNLSADVPGEFTYQSNCGASVAPGASCTFTVSFAPISRQGNTTALYVSSDAGILYSAITGVGVTPITSNPSYYVFGNVSILGEGRVLKNFVLTNFGTTSYPAPLALSLTGDSKFFQVSGCASGLAVGTSCTLTVDFLPKEDSKNYAISIGLPDPATNPAISVSGTGVDAPYPSPWPLDFGNIYQGTTGNAVLSLSGGPGEIYYFTQPLSVSSPFSLSNSSCGLTLNQGDICSSTISLNTSTLGLGPQTGSVTVTSVNIATGQMVTQVVPITANVIPNVRPVLSSTDIEFGDVVVGTTATKTISLTNPGTATLPAFQIVRWGTSSPDITLRASTCGALAPGASCNLTFAYTPSGLTPAGVVYFGGILPGATGFIPIVSLDGEGISSAATPFQVSGSDLEFGDELNFYVKIGQSVLKSITVTNTTNTPLTNLQVATDEYPLPNDGFALNATSCPSTLAVGASCTITISFKPPAVNPNGYVRYLLVVYADGPSVPKYPYTGALTVVIDLFGQVVAAPATKGTLFVIGSRLTTLATDNSTLPASVSSGGGIGATVSATGSVFSIDTTGSSITKFDDTGAVYNTLIGGGLQNAAALAVDGNGTLWVANGNGTLSTFDSNIGNPTSAIPLTTSSTLSQPTSVSVDASGSVWVSNAGNNTVTEVIGVAAPAPVIVNGVINATPGVRP